MKIITAIAAFIIIGLCICSAGCVDSTVYPETNSDMSEILNSITDDLKTESDTLSADILKKAAVLGHLKKLGYEFKTEITRLYAESPDDVSVVYYDYETDEIYGYPNFYTYSFDFSKFPLTKKDTVKFLTIYDAKNLGKVIILGTPVCDKNGNVIGGLYYSFESYSVPSRIISQHKDAEGYYLTIDSKDGVRYYHPSTKLLGKEVTYKSSDVSENSGSYSYINKIGEPVSAVYNTVNLFGEDMIVSLNVRDYDGYDPHSVIYSTNVSKEGMTEFLRSVYTFAQTHTKTELADYANNLKDSEYPLYVITDGVVTASTNKEFINRDLNAEFDAYYVPVTKLEGITSNLGGGYLTSMIKSSAEHALYKAVPALVYILNIDSNTYIRTYIPLSDDVEEINISKVYVVNKAGKDSLLYIMKYGESKMYKAVTNNEIGYPKGVEGVVMSPDGVILANSLHPELVGTDSFKITDSLGISVSRNVISLENLGAGNMYYAYYDEVTGKTVMYLCSVEHVYNSAVIIITMIPIQTF
ncbi:MAG: hypothetical protein Q4Q53_05665 [Methanocorpusculum sp.]|nr:hypothetical protein [Methanocorpusculum sp.]